MNENQWLFVKFNSAIWVTILVDRFHIKKKTKKKKRLSAALHKNIICQQLTYIK